MNGKLVRQWLLIFLFSFGANSNTLFAAVDEKAAAKGLEIAKKSESENRGWVDQVSDVEMILVNKAGQSTTRILKIKSLEGKNDGDKSLTIFKSPKDVKGTAFLSFSHFEKDDDQWLYLPALKRVKRISSHNKSGPFMGSEFAYEDIGSQSNVVPKYTYKFVRDEDYMKQPTHVIERFPKSKNSGYTKQIVWIDKKHYNPHKIEFYDRKSELLKTLTMSGYYQAAPKVWRAKKFEMINHQTGKSTQILWNKLSVKNNLSKSDFNKNALKRVK